MSFGSHHVDKGIERGFVVVKDEHILADIDQFLHDHVLTLADKLAFRLDNGLEKVQVLDVTAVRLDAVHKMLDHFVAQFAAQLRVILEDGANRLRLQQLKRAIDFNRETYAKLQSESITPGVRNSSRCLCKRAWLG